MKKFIIKLFVFSILPIAYFGINVLVNRYIYLNEKVGLKKSSILIIGDSHPNCSLNPDLFNDAQNISQGGEPYVLTYWKLRKILKEIEPDTIIIGFSVHNFSKFNDLKFSDKRWAGNLFTRSYTFESFSELDDRVEVNYSQLYRTIWKETGFYPKQNQVNFIGKPSKRNTSHIGDWEKVIHHHYYDKDKILGVSEVAEAYLDSIIGVCEERNMIPILINSPVHESYYNKIPEVNLSMFDKMKAKYDAKGIKIIDKSQSEFPDSLYLNADHLNFDGATLFTREILSELYF